jgi:hypothetical protein
MPNLLALPSRLGKPNQPAEPANVLGDGVAAYETLAQRMRIIVDEMKKDGLSRRKLSATAGQSHAWVDTVLKPSLGDSAGPGAIALARLCEEYGYNVRWLITGLGPKLVDRLDDERAARERGEPAPVPRGSSAADEAALRLLEGRRGR